MNIQYVRSGDYYTPDLKLPEESRTNQHGREKFFPY